MSIRHPVTFYLMLSPLILTVAKLEPTDFRLCGKPGFIGTRLFRAYAFSVQLSDRTSELFGPIAVECFGSYLACNSWLLNPEGSSFS